MVTGMTHTDTERGRERERERERDVLAVYGTAQLGMTVFFGGCRGNEVAR